MFTQLNSKLQKALEKLNITQASPIQEAAIPVVFAGKDLMASAETGSGKTAAYLLPILQKMLEDSAPNSATRCLILVPTRELARQVNKQVEELTSFSSITAGVITGGAEFKYQKAVIRKNPEILIATPGRMLEHCKLKTLDLNDLEFIVLDEADKMLEFGFSEDVLAINDFCRAESQRLLFSATLTARGLYDITQKLLKQPVRINLNDFSEQQKQIKQQIIPCDDLKHKEKLVNWLLTNETYRKALVFCNTRSQVDRLGGLMRYHKHSAGTLHGENTQEVRNHVMTQFRDNKINVLIASDVAARGIDVKEVDLVINLDMAHNADDYIHRVGRTGRAGETGTAISLISNREWDLMATVEAYLKTKFERRIIKALLGKYTGPKNIKANGKAASKGKRNAGKKLSARDKKRLDKKKASKLKEKKNKKSASELAADPIMNKPKKKFGGLNIDSDGLKPLRKK